MVPVYETVIVTQKIRVVVIVFASHDHKDSQPSSSSSSSSSKSFIINIIAMWTFATLPYGYQPPIPM